MTERACDGREFILEGDVHRVMGTLRSLPSGWMMGFVYLFSISYISPFI